MVQALGNSTSRRSWGEDELREGGVGVSSLREVTVVAAFSAPPPTLRCGLTRLGAPADCSLEELPPPPPPPSAHPASPRSSPQDPSEVPLCFGTGTEYTSGVWGMLEFHSSQTHHLCALGNLPLKSWASLLLAGGFGT